MEINKELENRNIQPKGLIHIGAHIGQELVFYNQAKIENIILFEPLKEVYIKLEDNVKTFISDLKSIGEKCPNIITIQKALGNEITTKEMWVEENNGGMSSSLLEPNYHKIQYEEIIFDKKELVEVSKLDEELKNIHIDFNIMNIDVQGYELEVLKGGIETLKNIEIIFVEVNNQEMYKDCALVTDLDKFLGDFNFKRDNTHWYEHNGVITWGDAIYIKG